MIGPLTYGILSSGAVALWTPASPTTDGGVSPIVWEVPGVANYQDAAKTTVAGVGDVVGAVVNQGSDTHDITQATTAAKPTLQQVTINTVTSYVWRFDGTDDYLQGAFGGGAISQPHTAFAVAKLDATSATDATYRYIMDGNSSGSRAAVFKNSNKTWRAHAGVGLIDGVSDGDWNVFTALFSGASSVLRKNGASVASGNAGTNAPLGITVGSNLLGSDRWKGDIGPILIYAGNLSTADKNQIGEYLERVTGIAWTTIV